MTGTISEVYHFRFPFRNKIELKRSELSLERGEVREIRETTAL